MSRKLYCFTVYDFRKKWWQIRYSFNICVCVHAHVFVHVSVCNTVDVRVYVNVSAHVRKPLILLDSHSGSKS